MGRRLTPSLARSSFDSGADMMTRLAAEWAVK